MHGGVPVAGKHVACGVGCWLRALGPGLAWSDMGVMHCPKQIILLQCLHI